MKNTLMAAAAAFSMTVSAPVFAQDASAEAEPHDVSAETAPAATEGACPFKAVTSNYECADAAKAAFEAFGKKVGEARNTAYPDLARELYELRGKYLGWFNRMKAEGLLKKGESLRVVTEQAVEPVIIGVTRAVNAKYKTYYNDVTYQF